MSCPVGNFGDAGPVGGKERCGNQAKLVSLACRLWFFVLVVGGVDWEVEKKKKVDLPFSFGIFWDCIFLFYPWHTLIMLGF